MKKFKKILALVTNIALLCTTVIPFSGWAGAEEVALEDMIGDGEYNVALNKPVTAYPGLAEGTVDIMVDGELGEQDASSHATLSQTGFNYYGESYVTIDLGELYDASTIDQVVVQYRYGTANVGTATVVGKSYSVQYSYNDSDYVTVAETSNTALDAERMTYDDVSGVTGSVRYVRIYYPENVQWGIQILEIAVLDTDKDLAVAGSETAIETPAAVETTEAAGTETTTVVETTVEAYTTAATETTVAETQPGETATDGETTTQAGEVSGGTRHSQYMYLISVSENKLVQIDTSSNVLKADGDISLLDDVDSMPDNALFYTVEGTDSRFENYVAIRSPYNNSSVSGQSAGLSATGGSATGGWEVFKFIMQEDGTVALFSTNGDSYVTVDSSDGKLKPGASAVSDSEKFIFVLPMSYSDTPVTAEVEVSDRTMDAIALDWQVDHGFYTGFEIYRSESDNGEYVKIAETVATEYTDSGLDAGKTYYYRIVTVCESLESEAATVTAKTLSTPAAEKPENIDISSEDKTVVLKWDAAQYAVSYDIYRSTGRYSTYEKIASTDDCTYRDTVSDSVYTYYYKLVSVNADGLESEQSEEVAMDLALFGDTLQLFSPSDDTDQVNSIIKGISDVQMKASLSEFSDDRYAIVFKPGEYDIDTVNVGFYTQVLGLGATPYDTKIGNINVDKNESENVLINFWRGIENLYIDSGSSANEVKYGASQAAPLRRLYVNGKLHLDDIGTTASGGFIADTYVTGQTGSWSQQQFMVRNTYMTDGWYDGVWNMLFLGCYNAPESTADWANASYQSYTTVDETPVIREKPFLYLDDEGYKVFVPGLRENATGVSWSENDMGVGTSIDIDDFYVAKADTDDADSIGTALKEGKNILFTPGVYELDQPLEIENPDTVILGLGLATLVCKNTDTAIRVADVDGVTIAGLIIEAGDQGSETLVQVGTGKNNDDNSDNPILLSDLFFRVGGTRIGKTEKCLEINSNDVIGDHFWIWRADHGAGASWTESTADNGLVVNGDDVTVYGLFVEHFQKNQVLWNGNNGSTYFYQSELPYDVPYQTDWMSNGGTTNGYASYKVTDSSTNHLAVGMGVYEVFIYTQEYITLDNAIEVSVGTQIINACTVSLSAGNSNGKGEITHIVNGQGDSVGTGGITAAGVKKGINSYYCSGIQETTTATGEGETTKSFEETTAVAEESTVAGSGSDTETTVSSDDSTVKAPGRAIIKKIKKKKKSAKKIKLTIKKMSNVKGYQIKVYKTKKKAKKNVKAIIKKNSKKRKLTLKSKKLKNKEKLFVRVRAYVLDSKGNKVYGRWSKVKKVKVK